MVKGVALIAIPAVVLADSHFNRPCAGIERPITTSELPAFRSLDWWRRCPSFHRLCRWRSPRLASYRRRIRYGAMRQPQGYCWRLRHWSSSGWPSRHGIMWACRSLHRDPVCSWYWTWGLSFAPMPASRSWQQWRLLHTEAISCSDSRIAHLEKLGNDPLVSTANEIWRETLSADVQGSPTEPEKFGS